MTIYYCKIDSRLGSKSVPTFSNKTILPNYTDNSIVFIKLGSFIFIISIPSLCSLPIFLINLLAYVYGSIINGHLLDLSIIIPFSVEVSSLGNPAIFHY